MAKIIKLPSFVDDRGDLTVMDNVPALLPFQVKRVFFINAVTDAVRGGHRHHKTKQAVICIQGECIVTNNDGHASEEFVLNTPNKCLLLNTGDWHQMHSFHPYTVLLVFASECYEHADYIFEPYKPRVNDTVRELVTSQS